MARDRRKKARDPAFLALALLACGAGGAGAQVSLVNLNYESPALVAPALIHLRPMGNGDVTLSLVGWTLAGELRRPRDPAWDWLLSLDATPLNAHRSDAVYHGGVPEPDSGFGNSSWQARAGFRRKHGARWTGDYRLSLLYEPVDAGAGPFRPDLEDRWDRPFLGLDAAQAAERVLGSDPIRNRWEGWKASARLQAYAGERTWWRGQAHFGLGRKWERLFLKGSGTLLLGNGLDPVSRHLVGGGWELPGVHALPGWRYGELRVEEGLLASAGADWAVAGPLEIGLRAGLLARRRGGGSAWGEGLRVSWMLPGSALALGWGFRRDPFGPRALTGSVVSASWTAALWTPFGAD